MTPVAKPSNLPGPRSRRRRPQPYSDSAFKAQVFRLVHAQAHFGIRRFSRASLLGLWGFGCTVLGLSVCAVLWLPTLRTAADATEDTEELVWLEEVLTEPEPEIAELPPPPPPPEPEPPVPQALPPVAEPEAPLLEAPENEPPPVFGLEADALSESGDMAVATGNTLRRAADSVVQPPPPPLPKGPMLYDRPPEILRGRAPVYPGRALQRGLEATVVALITIDSTGQVTEVTIEKSGGRDFDREVERSARTTVFRPLIRDGRPIAVKFRRPYEFRLE